MKKIYIIGIGPGNEDYLTPIAKKQIKQADCLIGAERLLVQFNNFKKEKIILKSNYNEIIAYIKENKNNKKIAVLVSGDPGLFSFAERLSKELKNNEFIIIPGISSMQIAFAKIGLCWHNVKIVSLHGRDLKDQITLEIKTNSIVFLFTDKKYSPDKIAKNLINKGMENRKVFVLENLTYENERIIDTNLKELSKMRGFDLCVMIITEKIK